MLLLVTVSRPGRNKVNNIVTVRSFCSSFDEFMEPSSFTMLQTKISAKIRKIEPI